MEFPSLSEYWDALQLDLGIVLSDPALGRARVRARAPGRPVVYGGTFAYTFRLATDTGEYALRCFRREFQALDERYRAIQAHLRQIRSPHFADVQFQPAGITTETGDYPVVRLDWVEGQGLATFVERHLGDAAALQGLRLTLRRLAQHLHANGVAHGDIQPSNIIVEADGNLRLVDYDGMFVPALASLASVELGQRHFQHPGRRSRHFDANLDAFPFAVIDVALHALCLHPQLWDHTASGHDCFLFRATDLGDPTHSAIFQRLGQDAALAQRVRDLASVCLAPFEQIPPFEDFLASRNIPDAAVGQPASRTRAAYLPVCPVVDASDFSQCCKHVGERVELVGRVVHAARSAVGEGAGANVSLEFDVRPRDLVCALVWPEAMPAGGAFPAHDWVGQWVSATGLVEPVARDGAETQHRKFVAISVTELCQLRRLPEAEARERLHASDASGERAAGGAAAVWTDPVARPGPAMAIAVEPGPAAPVPAAAGEAIQAGPLRGTGGRRGWLTVAGTLAAAFAVILVVLMVKDRHRAEVVAKAPDAVAVPEPTAGQQVAPAPATTTVAALQSQRALQATDDQLATAVGMLRIAAGEEGTCRQAVRLDDEPVPDTCDESLVFVHHAVFADREVVVGLRKCGQESAACRWRRPFWLELRPGEGPTLREQRGLWAGSEPVAVEASDEAVRVDLGIWNGERRVATLTATGNLVVQRERVPSAPLSRDDCSAVARSLDDCAASRECASFADAARRIPAARWASLERLYHESTGLEVEAYRKLCVRACQLGMTPSPGLVRQYACQGAQPGQWPAGDPASGLER